MTPVGQTENLQNLLLQYVQAAVFVIGPDLHVVYANDYAARLMGIPLGRLIGISANAPEWTFLAEDGSPLPPEQHPAARLLATGEAVTGATIGVVHRETGNESWALVNVFPEYTEQAELRRIVVTAVDLTERKRAERAEQASRAKLEAALASMTDAVYITDAEGRCVDFNEAFLTFHRFRGKEELLRPASEYPQVLEAFLEDGTPAPLELWPVPRALRGETASDAEYTLRRRDTGETWVGSYSFGPIRDAGGAIVGSVVVGRDVTRRKQSEKALQDSEKHFSQIFHGSSACQLLIASADRTIVDVNAAFCRLMDFGWQDVVGRTTEELGIWLDLEVRKSILEELRTRGTVHAREVDFRTRGGEHRTLVVSADTIDLSGVRCDIWSAVDITERKRMERAVVESELKHRMLFDHAGMPILFIALDGTCLMANLVATDYLGTTPEAVLGRRAEDVVGPKLAAELMEGIRLAASSDEILTREHHLEVPVGERWFTAHYHRVQDGEGRLLGVQVVAIDITARKSAEMAWRESEEQFRALVDGAPDGICVQSRGVFRFVNPAMARLLGIERPEDLLDTSYLDRVVPELRDLVRERIRAQLESGQSGSPIELELLRHDGSRVRVETAAVPIRFERRAAHLVFTRDLTVRLQAEAEREALREQLVQSQKMESVGRLAGGVAHDFNNILMVQKGYCELMLRKLRKDDPLAESLAQVHASVDRAAALTRQLLAFSRKQTLQPKVIDLNGLVRDMEKMLRRIIGEDVTLVTVPSPVSAVVKADPGQLEQVIVNLAVNARDAMPLGGSLRIELASATLDGWCPECRREVIAGPYVTLAVTDTGHGMDDETRRKVFEPFFTTKGQGKGTGLGLSTVDGIVHQSGGCISVDSAPGRGTTFRIFLPRVEEEPARPSEPIGGAVHGKGEAVLVVEDEDTLRDLTAQQLKELGYRVSSAANGGEALIMVEENGLKVDLVVTDVVMPGMSGRVMVDRLRRSLPDVKVVYMSGYMDEAMLNHGVLEADVRLLRKPFSLSDLAEVARATLAPR